MQEAGYDRAHHRPHPENDRPLVAAMVRAGLVEVAFTASDHLAQLAALADRYADRRPDFADVCLIRMSELHPRHPVITVDRADFSAYRRNKREVIPVIRPPGQGSSVRRRGFPTTRS